MDREERKQAPEGLRLEAELLPAVNYALHQNKIPFLRSVTVVNETGAPVTDVDLVISARPPFCRETRQNRAEAEAVVAEAAAV